MKNLLLLFITLSFLSAPAFSQVTVGELPRAGVNVTWQNFDYFSGSAALTNAFKQSGAWWGTDVETDEHGYPTSLGEEESVQTAIFLETIHYPTGDYTFIWEGTGSMVLRTCDEVYNFDSGAERTQTIPIATTTCGEGVNLTITETDTNDHIRDIRFYLPGYDSTSSYWTDHYIDFHAQFSVSRFAWGSGMYSPQSEWEQRSKLKDRNWRDSDEAPMVNNGVPYEAMIDLANQANTDLWISTPVRANSEFERELAILIRDNLDPELKIWIEWGNEYWNCGVWGYQGCIFLDEQDSLNSDPEIDNPHLYAREALDLFSIFDSVFSATNERDRLYTVLGGQLGNAWQLQESTNEIQRQGRMDEVDLFTIAPYYSGTDQVLPAFESGGLDAAFPVLDTVMNQMFDGIGEDGVELLGNFEVARRYNKPMVAYEGGQHLTGWVGLPPYFAADVSHDERIYDHYMRYFNRWEEVDVTATFVHYSDIAQYHEDEAFPLIDNYNMPMEEAPKLRAFLDWQAGANTVQTEESTTPSGFEVMQNYPNPFNPSTMISFQLSASTQVNLDVYDMTGRKVRTLLQDQMLSAGMHSYNFDGTGLSSGMYIYQVITPNGQQSRTMVLLK